MAYIRITGVIVENDMKEIRGFPGGFRDKPGISVLKKKKNHLEK
jgi:hypothetical protein